MSNNDLMGFEEQAHRVRYAYDNTQRYYDEYPPNDDIVPIAAAINAWTLICGCYMGIEQTMKLLIWMRGGTPKQTHDLGILYSSLDPSERSVVADYYRVYRSLHNFDAGKIALPTADEFIRYIGKGYTSWRYILVEGPDALPSMHLGVMLDTWQTLADLAQHRAFGLNGPYQTVSGFLEDYIDGVFNDAEMDDEWQANPQFNAIRKWAERKGGTLKAGIDLFRHYHRHQDRVPLNPSEASQRMSEVLLGAVGRAVNALPSHRRADIVMFHYRVREDNLAWNAEKKVFESYPATGFDQESEPLAWAD